jgi:hypothetical protein
MAAGLNDVNAVALAQAFCSANGITDAAAVSKWESFAKILYAHLKTDVSIVIATGSIATTGTAAAQVGPAAPIPISPL